MIHRNPREIRGYKFQERQRDAFEEHKAIKFYHGRYGEENVKILAMTNQYGQPYTDIYVKVEALRHPKRRLVAQFGSAMEFEGPGGERVGDTIRVHEGPGGRKSMHITQRNPRSGHTPGPWEARQHHDGSHWFVDHEQGGEGYTLVDELSKGDALLIAAAPEMIEMLKEIDHKIHRILASEDMNVSSEVGDELTEISQDIYPIVIKAEGRR